MTHPSNSEMKEFLSVCPDECAHPYCWSQKSAPGEQRGGQKSAFTAASNGSRRLTMNLALITTRSILESRKRRRPAHAQSLTTSAVLIVILRAPHILNWTV